MENLAIDILEIGGEQLAIDILEIGEEQLAMLWMMEALQAVQEALMS